MALGRALARAPRVFLLDEPFSSLDAPLRAALRSELTELHRRIGATMIHVTHDQAEALAIGDRIAVMDRGRIVQSGTPLEVYDRPACRFVAEFVGSPPMNVLPCVVDRTEASPRIRVEGTDVLAGTAPEGSPERIDLGIRPEHVHIDGGDPFAFETIALKGTAEVRRLEPLGHETLATLGVGAHPLIVRLASRSCPAPGERVRVSFESRRIVWFDAGTGAAIAAGQGAGEPRESPIAGGGQRG